MVAVHSYGKNPPLGFKEDKNGAMKSREKNGSFWKRQMGVLGTDEKLHKLSLLSLL